VLQIKQRPENKLATALQDKEGDMKKWKIVVMKTLLWIAVVITLAKAVV
jgi:hypothetical protein